MPNLKTHVRLAVPTGLDRTIQRLARRDDVSAAQKTLDLLRNALELEEDVALRRVAEARDRSASRTQFLSHKAVWG